MLLYIEEQILDHPRTQQICNFFPKAEKIIIKHYKNIFDRKFPHGLLYPKGTSFGARSSQGPIVGQKNILVLAKLTGSAISKAPDGYGHSQEGWFFKTTLNCLFDCQYCYLKGAFKNDFPVIFVNYEDIGEQVRVKSEEVKVKRDNGILNGLDPSFVRMTETVEKQWWYMSDWSDTQGFDKMLGTHEYFFQLFESMEGVMCETRTKAADISTLVKYAEQHGAPQHIEVAYSLNPQELITQFEKGTASLDRRIENINRLLDLGYRVGIRFMPLLPVKEYLHIYSEFLEYVTTKIDMDRIYSSFAGGLLYTHRDYKKIAQKEPGFQDILSELSDAGDGFYREKREVRQELYALFKKYVSNCFVCLDEY